MSDKVCNNSSDLTSGENNEMAGWLAISSIRCNFTTGQIPKGTYVYIPAQRGWRDKQ